MVFLSLSGSETRSPDPFSADPSTIGSAQESTFRPTRTRRLGHGGPVPFTGETTKREMIERAREMLVFAAIRRGVIAGQFEPTRISPGGPDPKHH
ncbi:hypothetical protein U1Q18_024258 [Sarracenia purpurea var. burkii]